MVWSEYKEGDAMCLSSVYYELDKAGGARSWKKRQVEKEKQREREKARQLN